MDEFFFSASRKSVSVVRRSDPHLKNNFKCGTGCCQGREQNEARRTPELRRNKKKQGTVLLSNNELIV